MGFLITSSDFCIISSFLTCPGLKPCGGVSMVNQRMEITSPDFPGGYPQDKTCVWRLCPPRRHRVKFHFNTFQLHPSDYISIDNECEKSQASWRTYCGSVSSGEFVSKCKNKCVQLRMYSGLKFQSEPLFTGLNMTVEPTLEKRTKKFDAMQEYCRSSLVIKARFVSHNTVTFNSIKVFAFNSFKEPFRQNTTYDIKYKNEDRYGCYRRFDLRNDYFYFATIKRDDFIVETAVADDGSREASYLKNALLRYKNNDTLCRPPEIK